MVVLNGSNQLKCIKNIVKLYHELLPECYCISGTDMCVCVCEWSYKMQRKKGEAYNYKRISIQNDTAAANTSIEPIKWDQVQPIIMILYIIWKIIVLILITSLHHLYGIAQIHS